MGKILNVEKHPNADRLNITVVNIGEEDNYRIVCGAPNVKEGQKVIVAKPGTIIYPTNGDPFKIKKANIRGEDSFGMICAKMKLDLETITRELLFLITMQKLEQMPINILI